MTVTEVLLAAIREAFDSRRYVLTLYAVRQAEERKIAIQELEEAVRSADAEIIENYLEDERGPSCLLLGVTMNGRVLHIQLSHPPAVWVITAYEPSDDKWTDAKTRR